MADADVVDLDERALRAMGELVARVDADQLLLPTPCDEWTVRDLLAHIVAVNVKYAGIGRGDPWLPGSPDVQLGADPARSYDDTVPGFLEAWRSPGALEREVDVVGRRWAAELALWVHLRELLVHGWDLAVSVGQPAPFDGELVEASLLNTDMSAPARRPSGIGFADAVDAPPDADPLTRLAAWFGRDVTAWA